MVTTATPIGEENNMKKIYTDDCCTIFSLRLANYLERMGFMIIDTRDDLKDTGRKVFLFANTFQLRKAIDTYMS